jgi:hypothetical protein
LIKGMIINKRANKRIYFLLSSLVYAKRCAGLVSVFMLMAFGEFTINSAPQTAPQNTDFVLEYGKAGPFEVGEPVDNIYRLVGRDRVRLVALFGEGMFEPALEIQLPGLDTRPSIIARISERPCSKFSIWGMSVRDQRFRTHEGLGIGSTLGELRKHYKVEVRDFAESDKVNAFAPSMNLSFELDAVLTATDLSKVISVWVTLPPNEVRKRRCPDLGPLP